MFRIDAHQHFWQFDAVRDAWITEDMQVLRQDFLPQHLQPLLAQAGMDGCVAVQADQSETETSFLLQLAAENDFIKGVVGWVDLQAENVEERLEYYSQFPKLKGFRHIVQGEQDDAFMLRPSFQQGIRLLQQFGFTYDILIYPKHLPYAIELVARFPQQKFIVDHLAKPHIKRGEISFWKQEIEHLAQHPNVCCKVSGLVTEADWKGWKGNDFAPYLDVVTAAFGTHRLVYGSDWPVCLLAARYEEQLNIVQKHFETFSEAEQARIFGGNAQQFYAL